MLGFPFEFQSPQHAGLVRDFFGQHAIDSVAKRRPICR